MRDLYEYVKEELSGIIKDGQIDKLYVAVSGGADSMALLALIIRICRPINIHLGIIHIHHGLREASDQEALLVESYAKSEAVDFFCHRVDLKMNQASHQGIEEAAREARYTVFETYKGPTTLIALGHHQEDQAETIMMNLLRGSGLKGLGGMQPRREGYIRPLLNVSKEALVAYCHDHKVPYVQDESNFDISYRRNHIRHELLPWLKNKYNPKVISQLTRMGQLLRGDEDLLNDLTQAALEEALETKDQDKIVLSLNKVRMMKKALQMRLLRLCFEEVSGDRMELTQDHLDQVINMIHEAKTGKKVILTKKRVAEVVYDRLLIYQIKGRDLDNGSPLIYELPLPGPFELIEVASLQYRRLPYESGAIIPSNRYTKWFDYDKIGNNLVLRHRMPGDFIRIQGTSGKKKLKDDFIDRKIPREERDRFWILACGQEVLWVVGDRYNPAYGVDQATKEILEIVYKD